MSGLDDTGQLELHIHQSILTNAPANSTKRFPNGQDRKRWRKDWNENHDSHPTHKYHHCYSTACVSSALVYNFEQRKARYADPKRSCVYELTISPASCPTSAELDKPDCHDGGISFLPGSPMPNLFWN